MKEPINGQRWINNGNPFQQELCKDCGKYVDECGGKCQNNTASERCQTCGHEIRFGACVCMVCGSSSS